mmetsp:Transcript_8737/g.12836  ORF Transcript_8737/g.12836 Transcript_8737/m.12836 type:complete len:108 (-) Transcript_8737:220-543(-)
MDTTLMAIEITIMMGTHLLLMMGTHLLLHYHKPIARTRMEANIITTSASPLTITEMMQSQRLQGNPTHLPPLVQDMKNFHALNHQVRHLRQTQPSKKHMLIDTIIIM